MILYGIGASVEDATVDELEGVGDSFCVIGELSAAFLQIQNQIEATPVVSLAW